MKFRNLKIGTKYNFLTTISSAYKKHKFFVNCLCDCGKFTVVRIDHLVSGHTKSCGHLLVTSVTIHGFTSGNNPVKRKFYKTWSSLRDRCLNKKNKFYLRYGGTGIKICERWLGKDGFIHFKEDMWGSYMEHIKIHDLRNTTLDRYPDSSGNYEPSNCRWATYSVQQNNRRSSPKSSNITLHRKFISCFLTQLARLVNQKTQNSKSKYLKYLGCSVAEFKQYFQSLFCLGMTWDNHGNGIGEWNFGHIIGCNNFDLSKEEDRYKCFNYKNLRPEWSFPNRQKRKNKIKLDNNIAGKVSREHTLDSNLKG